MIAPTAFPEGLRGKWVEWDYFDIEWVKGTSNGTAERHAWIRGVRSSAENGSMFGKVVPSRVFIEAGLPHNKRRWKYPQPDGLPHYYRPDLDNVIKQVLDAYTMASGKEDQYINAIGGTKVFAEKPYVRIWADISGVDTQAINEYKTARAEKMRAFERARTKRRQDTPEWREYHNRWQRRRTHQERVFLYAADWQPPVEGRT